VLPARGRVNRDIVTVTDRLRGAGSQCVALVPQEDGFFLFSLD
jgi:hypothetical protein